MSKQRTELINTYRQKVKAANKELTKKELFKDLLNRLYAGVSEIEEVIDAISAGAETTIVKIPRKDRFHKGRSTCKANYQIMEKKKIVADNSISDFIRQSITEIQKGLQNYL